MRRDARTPEMVLAVTLWQRRCYTPGEQRCRRSGNNGTRGKVRWLVVSDATRGKKSPVMSFGRNSADEREGDEGDG